MRHRFILRVATVVAALVLSGPAVASANSGGHPHSAKACPAHKHSGKHKGHSKGHKNGATTGKKCGASVTSADSATRKNTVGNGNTTGDDQGDQSGDDQGDQSGDDQGDQSGDDQGDQSGDDQDNQDDTSST